MSLEGNLEELGLGEILQIVSLSRKTGVLFLSSKGRDGSVFFRHGQVVRATSSAFQQSLGEVLIQKGAIDLALLRKALAYQQKHGFCERIGVILAKKFGISAEVVEEVVREQIENVVFSLFTWSTGTFRFAVQDTIETVDDTKMDPLQFMLEQGLNPQFLALEGTRIQEENRQAAEESLFDSNGPDVSEAFDFDLTDRTENQPSFQPQANRPVVIVDDDGPTLRTIADGLSENGFIVHAMTRSEDTLVMVDSLHRSGVLPVVLIDLIMPKMDGSGVLGGVELLELLHANFNNLQLMVMSDYHHADAEKTIHDLGYQFVIKPRRSEINTPDILNSFLTQVMAAIGSNCEVKRAETQAHRFNLGDELRSEMGEDDDIPQQVTSADSNGGLTLLRGMLEELNNPDLEGGVLLLVLRFASEFLNRAIIFTLDDQIISGFGQFGITGGALSGDERVRSIHFPLGSGSMFDRPLQSGTALTFSPELTQVDSHIFDQLGSGIPSEVFIGPLISQSKVIGFLYGDNLPDRTPIGDVEPLTIFLAQAAISMERSLLERKLHERGTP